MDIIKDLLLKGGAINIILFAAYILVMLIVVERMIFFVIKRGNYKRFMDRLRGVLSGSTLATPEPATSLSAEVEVGLEPLVSSDSSFASNSESIGVLEMDELPYQRSFYFGLVQSHELNKTLLADEREKLMVIYMSECKVELERGLTLLHIIGTLAPMMGLLGTMLGLVKSFRGIESMGGAVDISILAGGIWEAMLTTIAGLIVGIIALLALKLFQSRITLVSNRLEDLSLYLDVRLKA